MPRQSPINARLAARLHQRQIAIEYAIHNRKDGGITGRVQDAVVASGRRMIARLAQSSDPLAMLPGVRREMNAMWQEIANLLYAEFAELAQESHKQAADVLVKTLPPRWFRPKLMEATVPDPFGFFPPRPPRPPFPPAAPAPGGDFTPPFPPRRTGAAGDAFGRPIRIGPLSGTYELEPVIDGGLSDEEQRALVRQVVFPSPSKETLDRMVFSRDTNGQTWLQRLQGLSRRIATPEQVAGEIVTGFASGENVAQLTKRLERQTGLAASSAKRVARTEAKRIANLAQKDSFAAMGDLVIGWQYNAQLDQNTRPEHALLNGAIQYNDGRTSTGRPVPEPPWAPNCRCFTTPVLRPPAEIEIDPAVRAEFENASADLIPDPAAYDQWFAGADEQSRKEAVGLRKYNAVKDSLQGFREPEWSDFLNPESGQLLSMQALQGESPLERLTRKNAVQTLLRERERAFRQVSSGGFLLQ